QHATKALFEALNPLLTDRLDHSSIPAGPAVDDVAQSLLQTVKDEHEQQTKGRKTQDEVRQQTAGIGFVRKHFSQEVTTENLQSIARIPDEALSLLSSELRAALNTMLHISDNVCQGEVCPGNIFFVDSSSDNNKKLREKLSKQYPEH